MILLSFEVFPDSLYTIQSLEWDDQDRVACMVTFSGTKVISAPLEPIFKTLRTQLKPLAIVDDDLIFSISKLIREIAENLHPSVVSTTSAGTLPACLPSTRIADDESSQNDATHAAISSELSYSSDASEASLGKYQRSLPMEYAVLKDGFVQFKRMLYFYFDANNQVIHITGSSID